MNFIESVELLFIFLDAVVICDVFIDMIVEHIGEHFSKRLIMTVGKSKCEGFRWLPLACRTLRNGWVKAHTFADVVGNGHGINCLCDISLYLYHYPFSLYSCII